MLAPDLQHRGMIDDPLNDTALFVIIQGHVWSIVSIEQSCMMSLSSKIKFNERNQNRDCDELHTREG